MFRFCQLFIKQVHTHVQHLVHTSVQYHIDSTPNVSEEQHVPERHRSEAVSWQHLGHSGKSEDIEMSKSNSLMFSNREHRKPVASSALQSNNVFTGKAACDSQVVGRRKHTVRSHDVFTDTVFSDPVVLSALNWPLAILIQDEIKCICRVAQQGWVILLCEGLAKT